MARIFKGRYYPRSEFLDAQAGYQPSYAWRSLIQAKEVMQLGARWVIGNGLRVSIFKDGWIPNQPNFLLPGTLLPSAPFDGNATVSELIDRDTKQWNRSLVSVSFNPYAANLILNIPISLRLPEDRLTWHWEKNGSYSVRSAHHLLCSEKTKDQPEASIANKNEIWTKVWSVPIPRSAQNFLWRMLSNILPTRINLSKKGIQLDAACPLCSNGLEDREHLFMKCPAVKAVWFSSTLGLHVPSQVDFITWCLQWLSNSEILVQQQFGILLWQIWRFRNQLVFNNSKFDPVQVSSAASLFVEEFNRANSLPKNRARNQRMFKWQPPGPGLTKINIDAGCFQNGSIGYGMVGRDSAGHVLFAATQLENLSSSPVLAETLCLRWCLVWVKNQNLSGLIIESDAESVIKCLYDSLIIAEIAPIIADCVEILLSLENVSVVSVSRNCNELAHSLASASKDLGSCMWEGSVPAQCYNSLWPLSFLQIKNLWVDQIQNGGDLGSSSSWSS